MIVSIFSALAAVLVIYCGWMANNANFLMWQKHRAIPDYHVMTVTRAGGLDKQGRLIDADRTAMLRSIWAKRAWLFGSIAAAMQLV